MSILEALIYSLLGMSIVFLALILLMFFIKLLKKLTGDKPKKKAVPKLQPDMQQKAPGAAGEIKLYDTDPRDAAMCMAIVADMLKKPLEELRFISIREIK